jgi:pyruvate dehydrogenase E2 component (dihydrolipoyllysine-residue acetyltransferase)
LGQHRKPSRIRLPQAAPAAVAAAPTLASVAAAAFLSQQVPVAPLAATAPQQAAPRSAELDAAFLPRTMSSAQLASATRLALMGEMRQAWQAKPQLDAKTQPAFPTKYTVQAGDSLSAIAAKFYGKQAAWPVLYWRNHGQIRWANDIEVGQVLRVPAEPAAIPAPPAQLSPPVAPAVTTTSDFHAKHASTSRVRAQSAPAPAPAAVAPAPAAAAPPATASGPWPGGAFGNCVVERESGGNPDVWNASGHWGLYQFSASTWAEYGGSPADFGHAGVAEQEAVFMNALARGGEFNWAPYDGC